jgi:hypothetical protein
VHPIRKLREAGNATPEQFASLLDENVIMHSPLLIKAIVGRDAVAVTMAASSRNRDSSGAYVLERKLDERTTFLRWQGTIEGHEFESLELLTDGLMESSASAPSLTARFPRSKSFAKNSAQRLETVFRPTHGTTSDAT